MEINELKSQLFIHCREFVKKRIENLNIAIAESQESANQESKSTAGDKHDTSRAMMQLEVERLSAQLAIAEKMLIELKQAEHYQAEKNSISGKIIQTESANYFVAVAAGKISVNQQDFFVVSNDSPVVAALKKRNKTNEGEFFTLNGKQIHVIKIF